ncbi:hypothetical protein MCOR02_003741 [Pyricularia oryzae]|nr:hypothetical protein MCOR02_003741 [Pyricularia oryzae]
MRSIITFLVVAMAGQTLAAATAGLRVSKNAKCGSEHRRTCLGSEFGDCCSVNGWCGSDDSYCGTGCQPGFGDCSPAQASSTQPGPTDTVSVPGPSSSSSSLTVSQDATCGDGVTCEGSAFGNCCSINGWCGSDDSYCGMGCQAGFGTCGYSDSSSSSPSGTASPPAPSGGSASAVVGTATSTVASTLSTTTPEPTCAVNSACTVDLVELQTTKELNTPCGGAANKRALASAPSRRRWCTATPPRSRATAPPAPTTWPCASGAATAAATAASLLRSVSCTAIVTRSGTGS